MSSGPAGVALPGSPVELEEAAGKPRSLIDDCVHCGFCLPACPTYVSWSEEMDSPRGRIDLMRGLDEGKIELTDGVIAHFDRCLGCMGCMTACPSGVRYDVLIEQTRAKIEKSGRRSFADRLYRSLLFRFFPHPKRLAWLAAPLRAYAGTGLQNLVRRSGILSLLPKRLAQLDALAPASGGRPGGGELPERTPAAGPARARVALVAGCVQRVFFPEVNAATIRVLAAEGCDVRVPGDQGCCGALSMHAGREEEGLEFARRLIESFESGGGDAGAIVVNAAGCGSNLKDYGRLFADEPAWAERAAAFSARVRDAMELLAEMAPAAARHPVPLRVAYHDACHLAHAQGIRAAPRALLRQIPGLELLEVPDGDQCCGSAGIYNLTEPASADEIGARKAANVLSTRADLLASANPGCTLQI
ncbi:MAG TPA: heterodisulfide reductase-related iron-sulfur binding cluster, partial [Thermoanaerobaculia bacterium]